MQFSCRFSSCSESVSRKSSVESVASNDAVMAEDTTTVPVAATSPPLPLIPGQQDKDKEIKDVAAKKVAPQQKLQQQQQPTAITNNNSLPKEVSMEELELLKKLEEQNR